MATTDHEPEALESNLALGTVQLGTDYGIANRSGKPSLATALEIVRSCWTHGVRVFDTARAYGDAEAVLGRSLRRLGISREARVISKLDPELSTQRAPAIRRAVESSVAALGVPALWALLLHRQEQLASWDGRLGEALTAVRSDGLVRRLGVSVYDPEAALAALEIDDMEVIQVPASVFDRRMREAGFFERAAAKGRVVFVRSVYLQGLALLDPESLPRRAEFARREVALYADFCRRHGRDRRLFAIAYVRRMAPRARLVIGAETPEQAAENCELFAAAEKCAETGAWDELFPTDNPLLTNPSRWPVES